MSILVRAAAALSLAVQAGRAQQPRHPTIVRDSAPADSIRRGVPQRRGVTVEMMRTAYVDAESRAIVERARRGRLAQDSSLRSYEAIGHQRFSVTAGIGSGLQRVAYRGESAFHVRWRDSVGAEVELTGARVGIPMVPDAEQDALKDAARDADMTPVPYSSGQEALWPVSGTTRVEVDDRQIVHPLAQGAEAYYTYATGDSTSIRLPGGQAIRLRELKVRPRSPQSNLAVGSLWFDMATGQLVRAGYRLAAPITLHIEPPDTMRGDAKVNPITRTIVMALVSPLRAEISGVAVEYGLYQGRYWLPRRRSLQGTQQMSFVKAGIEVDQSFTYPTINGPASLTQVTLNEPAMDRIQVPDSLHGEGARKWRDSVRTARRKARSAFSDSLDKAACDSTGYRVVGHRRMDIDLPVAIRYPCDVSKLPTSSDLPGTLYGENEELFGAKERDELLSHSLPFGAQAAITLGALPRPDLQYGLSMTRYNRIEGLSTGIRLEQQLGGGYVASAMARIGTADHEPNAELALGRTNLSTTVTLTGYNRLVAANDWGNPFSFSASMSALFFGRDEGFYYRTTGAELTWTTQRGMHLDWRLFGEQERTARQHTEYNWGASFVPNVVAARGTYTGVGAHWLHTTGIDPRRLRTITDLRLEAATGDSSYGRAALDVTLTRALVGRLSGALTLSGGASAGALPPQRRWFLGGTQTIRGQSADTAQSGNAFWMTRAELASEQTGYRLALFSDLGWVGDRTKLSDVGRPMSGVGVGISMLDGMIRFDVARGLYPRRQTRLALYLGSRF
jgi:hypothetical protein